MTWGQYTAAHAPELISLPLLLMVSALFSASETALFSLSRSEVYQLSHGGRLEKLAVRLLSHPRTTLNTILLGNLLVNTAYAAASAMLVLSLEELGLAAWQSAIISLLPLVALILLAEIAPKSLALPMAMRLAPLAASSLLLLSKLFRPLLWVMDHVFVRPLTRIVSPQQTIAGDITAEELAALLELSAKRGLLNLQANALLQEIVELTDLRARDIMVPRVDMIACEVNAPVSEAAAKLRSSGLRRLPVYEGDLDHLLGIVYAKRVLLDAQAKLRDLVVKAPFVPESAKIERVLLQFRVTRSQMAFVVDEYGGTAGLVTLDDVLEEIVGEIPDPRGPELPLFERINERQYLLDGDLGIHEWADAFRIDLVGRRISTVGGFVMYLLGRLPRPGDTVRYRNLRFTVESMRKRRIEKLRLDLLEGNE